MPRRLFDLCYLVFGCVLFFALFHSAATDLPFSYDESDYMTSTRIGFAANYLDSTAMSFPQFVDTGMKALHKQLNRTDLSRYVRDRRDSMFFRHYHGPINAYWLCLASVIGGSGEHWMRLSGLVFHILTFLTIYLGILWVFGPSFRIAAVLSSTCYLFCVNNITSISHLSSHVPFLWLSLLTLFAICKLASAPRPRTYYLSLALCTVSLCALEYSVLLFGVLAVTVVLVRRKLFVSFRKQDYFRFARNTVLLPLVVCLVIWPSSLLKLTIVQGFAFLAFLSTQRHDAFKNVTPLDAWKARFFDYPSDMTILAACAIIAAILIWRSPLRRELTPLVLFGILLALTTLKNTLDEGRFISGLFAPFYIAAAILLIERLRNVPLLVLRSAAAALFIALIFISRPQVIAGPSVARVDDTVSLIAAMRPHATAKVLVPALQLPQLQYYFPQAHIESYRPDTPLDQVVVAAGSFDGVCLPKAGLPAEPSLPWAAGDVSIQEHLACYFHQ